MAIGRDVRDPQVLKFTVRGVLRASSVVLGKIGWWLRELQELEEDHLYWSHLWGSGYLYWYRRYGWRLRVFRLQDFQADPTYDGYPYWIHLRTMSQEPNLPRWDQEIPFCDQHINQPERDGQLLWHPSTSQGLVSHSPRLLTAPVSHRWHQGPLHGQENALGHS